MLLVIVFLALCRYIQSAHWDVFDDLRFGHNPVTDAFDLSICHFSWFAAMLQLCLVRQIMLRQMERQANLLALADEEPTDESSDSHGDDETPPQA